MASKKITKKQKNKLIARVIVLCIVLLMAAGSFIFVKVTTPPTLESVLDGVLFETNEVTLDVCISNKNETVNYEFVVSQSSSYIKIKKEINNNVETSIVYKTENQYYLYIDKEEQTIIELEETDGINMLNNFKTNIDQLDTYLDIDYKSVKYYYYSEELITFSNYDKNIFYDNEIVLKDNKLVNLKKVFTVDNIVNTVDISVDYTVDITIPNKG